MQSQGRNPATPGDSHENSGADREELLPEHDACEGAHGPQKERQKSRVEPITARGLLESETAKPG